MSNRPEWANPKWGDWANFPEAISEETIVATEKADVVILGAGISGMCAALRAAQRGADVIVVEKSSKWQGRGGNIGVLESSFLESKGLRIDREEFVREWIKRGANRCDEKIVWLFVNHCKEAMDWLFDIMTKDGLTKPIIQGSFYRGETYREFPGSHRFMDGPCAKNGARPGATDVVCELYRLSLELGVRFFFNTRGEQLIKENGRVVGAIASSENGFIRFSANKGVILATGDIGGNKDMCDDLSPDANLCAKNIYTPVGMNTGDGHRMGLWAGGIFEKAPFADMIHPQAYGMRNYCSLFVNHKGERFMNEDNYIQGKCLGVLRQNRSFAWSIIGADWDEHLEETLKYGGGIFWEQDHEYGSKLDLEQEKQSMIRSERGGNVVHADTIEELAEKMDVPADKLRKTFDRYEEMVKQGKDTDFGKRKELLISLAKAPYTAIKFGPALLVVCGGLRVNENLNVIDKELDPIEGLYAVGNACGGKYGCDYPMLTPGNSHGTAVTFGYLAGEIVAAK